MLAHRSASLRARSCACGVSVGLAVAACDDPEAATITVVAGPEPTHQARFAPTTRLAEVMEFPSGRDELRLLLAQHEASCDSYSPPGDDEAMVTVVLSIPSDQTFEPGDYPWLGAADTEVPRAALPKAQIGRKSYVMQPGGHLRLTHATLEPHGRVSGLLAFSFPGDGEHPASRIDGAFDAKICRYSEAPNR